MLIVTIKSIILNAIMLHVIMLNVIMRNVIMLNVIMLNVIMLNVLAPFSSGRWSFLSIISQSKQQLFKAFLFRVWFCFVPFNFGRYRKFSFTNEIAVAQAKIFHVQRS
jgi:hypothetical protein